MHQIIILPTDSTIIRLSIFTIFLSPRIMASPDSLRRNMLRARKPKIILLIKQAVMPFNKRNQMINALLITLIFIHKSQILIRYLYITKTILAHFPFLKKMTLSLPISKIIKIVLLNNKKIYLLKKFIDAKQTLDKINNPK